MAYIAELEVRVDTKQLQDANKVLGELDRIAPKVEKTLGGVSDSFKDAGAGSDSLTAAQERLIARVEKLTATVGESRAGVLRYDANLLNLGSTLNPLINQFDTLSTAQKNQDSVSKAIVKSQEQLSTAQYRLIESLREEIAVFGKSREEVLLYKAGLMGISDQVSPLITELQRLKQAKQEEATAGDSAGTDRVSKREREKNALAAEARELERIIELERERIQAASSGGSSSQVDTTRVRDEAALGAYQQKLDSVKASQRELDSSTDELSKEYSQLVYSIDPAAKALDDIALKQSRLDEIYRSGTLSITKQEYDSLSTSLQNARNRIEGVGSSVDGAESDFQQLRQSIDPVTASLSKLDAQQKSLQAAFNNKSLNVEQAEYERLNTIINNSRKRIEDLGATTGKTAKEINFALRGLPAQFTDIFVSLQGGQAPLTVLLQQGGQIKDQFGGIGPAFQALGGYVLGLINPLSLTAAALGTVALATYQGSNEITNFNKALILTGNRSAKTAQDLNALSGSIAQGLDTSRGKAASAVVEIAALGTVGSKSLEDVSRAAVAMNLAIGKAISDTVEEFAKLSSKPSEGILELNKKYNFLTASIYEQIVALEDQGRSQEAARVAEDAYAATIESRAEQVIENLNLLGKAWFSVKREATDAWDAMAGIGRNDDPAERIRQLRAELGRRDGPTIEAPAPEGSIFDYIPAVSIGKSIFESATGQSDAEKRAELDRLETQQRLNAESQRSKDLEEDIRKERLASAEIAVSGARAAETAVAKLNKKLEEQRAARFSLEETGGLTPELRKASDTAIADIEKKIKEAEAAAAKKDRGPTVKEDAGSRLVNDLEKRRAVLTEEVSTTRQLGTEEKKLRELRTQFDQLEEDNRKGILTTVQKQVLAQKDVILAVQQENVDLEKNKKSQEDKNRLLGIELSLQQKLAADKAKYAGVLQGIGLGDKEAARLAERNKLEQDYQKQLEDLGKRRAESGNPEDPKFQEEADKYKEALDQQRVEQEKFYKDEDAARGNWLNGVTKAYDNYIDAGKNVAGLTEGLFTSAFSNIESALSDFVTTGKLDFKSLSVSILSDLAKVATKIAVVKALEATLGSSGSGGGSGYGAIISALATSFAAKGKAYDGGTQFFAKGGAFTNSVVSKPTAFGTSTGLGVMGEAGPEAILPLTRTSDGQLGVQSAGGGSSSVVAPVSVTINTDSGASSSSTNTEAQGKAVQQAVKAETEKAIQNGLRPGGKIWLAMQGR